MALSDPSASDEQVHRSQEIMTRRREALERAAALERARASSVRTFYDEAGNAWKYVVLDGSSVRIESCVPVVEVICIPSEIQGLPVECLNSDACSQSPRVTEIVAPDSVKLIAPYAFRGNKNLRKLVLPALVSEFDFTWVHRCDKLEELHLPGSLEKLTSSVFDGAPLKKLVIGSAMKEIVPGAFVHSVLESVQVDPRNPYVKTDGHGLYSHDGRWLIALATPVSSYRVLEGCQGISKKAMSAFSCVERVVVPDSVRVLEDFALARTSIDSFAAPSGLLRIGEKAFYRCKFLQHVELNPGLLEIGAEAFTGTALDELRIPNSIQVLGKNPASETNLTYAGEQATFSIEEGSETLFLDHQGCLYQKSSDGVHLCCIMDPDAKEICALQGTRFVDEGAFAKHKTIEKVVLPEGLVTIGRGAFKDCHNLKKVQVPSTLERLEEDAFLDSGLESFFIPDSLTYIGEHALVTQGAHNGRVAPSLKSVEVSPTHELFYTVPGLLLERRPHGGIRCVLCTGGQEVLHIPEEVTAVSAYALGGQRGIRELHLTDNIRTVGVRGLGIDSAVELVSIRMSKPLEGHNQFRIHFPKTRRGKQQVCLVFGMLDRIDVAKIYRHYDTAIANAMNDNGKDSVGMTKHEQAVRVLERLADPVFMEPANRQLMRQIIESDLLEICADIARHDDRRAFDDLFDQGFLHGDNLDQVIDRVGMLQDASLTGYLLEAKRQRFGIAAMDFDL